MGVPAIHDLLTIGHSHHEWVHFEALLRQHEITAVADVRSSPYSRYTPQFNREPMQACLRSVDCAYAYLGRELGARRHEPECYDGRTARYDLVAESSEFRAGLERVRDGLRNHRVALLCAEKDPITCHRMVLVCRHLRGETFNIFHVLDDGRLESTDEVESRLLRAVGVPETGLFQDRSALVEEAYERQGRRLAWVEPDSNDQAAGTEGGIRS